MFDVDAEGPGHYFLLTCQSSSPSASRPRFESLNSAKIQGETLPEAEFMHKPHCILMAFTPYFVGYAWGIYREFGHRNSATVCFKFWGKKINLWMEAQIFMVSPNHWISTFIEQQSLWHHAFYTPLCPETPTFPSGWHFTASSLYTRKGCWWISITSKTETGIISDSRDLQQLQSKFGLFF